MEKDDLINKITFEISKFAPDNTAEIQNILITNLFNYDIVNKETELVEYNGSKNEIFLKKFLIAKSVAGCTKKTLESYKNTIWKTICEIGKPVDEVTIDDIKYYLAIKQTRDNVTLSYCDTILRYLRSFFNFLTIEELIAKNPTAKIQKIKCDKKKKSAFTEMEVELIRSACRNAREKMIIEVLISTACRITEFSQIKISDIEENGRLLIFGKGNKERYVYLNARAQLAVKEYLSERKDKNPYLNPGTCVTFNDKGNQLLRKKESWYKYPELISENEHAAKDTLAAIVRGIGRRACVQECHPHKFRRTCATFALRRGMPIEQVSKMLGHEELNTTQMYLDLTEKDLELSHHKYVV